MVVVVVVVVSTVSEAEWLVEASSITLECDTPMPLASSPFRQINMHGPSNSSLVV